jgi:DNA gyrase subunit B
MYTSEDIFVLSGLEAIRHRPGMFIGSTDKSGLHHLVKELIDNSVDEVLGGFCTRIDVKLFADGSCSVEDNGRGIPFDIHPSYKKPTCEVVMTTLHSGGKFNKKAYSYSGGLHGVGLSCVNALSEWVHVEIQREEKLYTQQFRRGNPQNKGVIKEMNTGTGTKIHFLPDARIFRQELDFDPKIIEWRLEELSYLHPTCSFGFSIETKDGWQTNTYTHPHGIQDYVIKKSLARRPVSQNPMFIQATSEDLSSWYLQLSLQWTKLYSQELKNYVNSIEMSGGGVHLDAILVALQKVIQESVIHVSQLSKFHNAELELRDITEGLTGMLSLLVSEPEFAGQTKDKLTNPNLYEEIEAKALHSLRLYFSQNTNHAESIVQRVYEAYISRVAGSEAGQRSVLQSTPVIATPEVYKSQFGERSKNWHDSAVWIAHEELLEAHGSFCVMPKESTCLDVCCGSGVVGASFRGRVSKIIGLDITPEMVALSKERLDEVVHGTVYDIPFPDNHFEVVSNREVMHLMPDPMKMMTEVFRVLKPGGQFIVGQIIPFSPIDAPWMFRIFKKKQPLLYHMFLEDDFEKLLTDAGLIDIQRKEKLVWEDIDVWIDTIETSSWHRHEIRDLYHNAPQSVKNVHPFEILPDGKIQDCWRWLIYSGRKPQS